MEAGLRSGRLPALLGEFAAIDRFGQELRRRIWLGLFYPLVLLGLCVALLASFSIAGREVYSTLRDFGVALPAGSMALMMIVESLGEAGWWALIGPMLAAVMILALRAGCSATMRAGGS